MSITPNRRNAFRSLAVTAVLALGIPAVVESGATTASAGTNTTIAALANANLKKGACSRNSVGGTGFFSSCTGNGGLPEYWCADFARWVWWENGVQGIAYLSPAAGSFYLYGQRYGTLSGWPAVGDGVVFDYNGHGYADHVAIVTSVGSDGTIQSVSGDWGGQSGSEAQFASTSAVTPNVPSYPGFVGTSSPVTGMTISGYVQPAGVGVVPIVPRTDLASGQTIASNAKLASPSAHYNLIMQSDGNLVLYTDGGRVLWASGTNGHPGAHALMSSGGALEVVSSAGAVLWSSKTSGKTGTTYLSLRDDGVFGLYGATGWVWTDGASASVLKVNQILWSWQRLTSPNGLYYLLMQPQGNLVEYTAGRALWSAGSYKDSGSRVTMGSDGNLFIRSAAGAITWTSGTGGHPASSAYNLALLSNGNLVISGPTGVIWNNHA
jgi:CHAP domain